MSFLDRYTVGGFRPVQRCANCGQEVSVFGGRYHCSNCGHGEGGAGARQ